MSIPNFITLGRIILVPVVFWLVLSGEMKLAFIAFVVAGVSDAVDGFLAKLQRLLNVDDLSGLFAHTPEALYVDDCCHVSPRGNALLGAAMGERLAAQWAPAPRPR